MYLYLTGTKERNPKRKIDKTCNKQNTLKTQQITLAILTQTEMKKDSYTKQNRKNDPFLNISNSHQVLEIISN